MLPADVWPSQSWAYSAVPLHNISSGCNLLLQLALLPPSLGSAKQPHNRVCSARPIHSKPSCHSSFPVLALLWSAKNKKRAVEKRGGFSRAFLNLWFGKLGACATTTKFLDNKLSTFKFLLSWRLPRKNSVLDDLPLCPLIFNPPEPQMLFLLSSRSL